MSYFLNKVRQIRNRSNVTAIEYGLIAALIGVAIIVGATSMGDKLQGLFKAINAPTVQTAPGK